MSAIGSLFGGSTPQTSQFQVPGMTGAANSAIGQIGGQQQTLSGLLQQYLPQLQQLLGYNTQAAQAGSGAAQQVAGAGQQIGAGSMQGAGNLQSGANAMIPYATDILNTAFDPQQALYNKLYQQNQDQANVQNVMSGVGSTPYGAGVADQSGQNFNINWQNQQLGREATGLGAAGTALGSAGTAYDTAQGLGTAGQNAYVQSAMLPYATLAQGAGANTQALTQGVGTATAATQPSIQDLLSYLGVGNQANQIYNQGNIGAQQAANQTQQLGFNELGTLAGLGFGLGSTPGTQLAPSGSLFGSMFG